MSDPTPQAPRSLTERRKAQTQLEIARCAAELFSERGANAVTAEDIATAAGIGLRTFYRYFRTKEDAVTPLLAGGVSDWIDDLARTPRGTPVVEALEASARRALSRSDRTGVESLRLSRGLMRAVPTDPALESVWFRIVNETEESLVAVLGDLMGPDADSLDVRLAAVAGNTAMRMAIRTWADPATADTPGTSPADIAVRCIRTLTAGLGPSAG
ncbi:TetR family transcriptional regulator [Rhodococcus spelaei]|uniref:TetR family transcriptional regulator n=1 Tax=Rhodococcus spelaei TaxID=2546320 RepID=A0A541B123_9NOCA|nr:TetR family transcriptional regulator [Rhodococcus spelaei]TQF66008.1 TetR family transcriptional regulator [Rhodococcus spelaei]